MKPERKRCRHDGFELIAGVVNVDGVLTYRPGKWCPSCGSIRIGSARWRKPKDAK